MDPLDRILEHTNDSLVEQVGLSPDDARDFVSLVKLQIDKPNEITEGERKRFRELLQKVDDLENRGSSETTRDATE